MRSLRAAFLVALTLCLPMTGEAQSPGEVFRKVTPSVVVIRARGSEVTAGGQVRFTETGSGVLISSDGKVMTAADVRQATALVRSGGFDLGVIDLDLTTAGGTMRNALELARFFRDSNPTAPLVLLVAEAGRDLEAEAGALHPALLLEKPINPARLRAVVRQLRKATAAS